jgi:3-dehydroquinate dehydratase-2
LSHFLFVNGPNLNLLGLREPAIYGTATLAEIEARLAAEAVTLGHRLSHFQSNHEGALVDRSQQARTEAVNGIIINAGAYTHTSIAIRDALAAVSIPYVEVHLSNLYARESFRHHSYLADKAQGVIVGFGPLGYRLALLALHEKLKASADVPSA